MNSLPWYIGWQSQRATHQARSHINGCLASMAHDHEYYTVCHDGIKVTIGQGLFDTSHPGDLSDVGISMFLTDIVLLIKCVRNPFQVAQEAKAMSLKGWRQLNCITWMQQCKVCT